MHAYDAQDRALRELLGLPMPDDWRENLEYLKQFGSLRDIAGILGVHEARLQGWDGGDIIPSLPSQGRVVDLVPKLLSVKDIADVLVWSQMYFLGTITYSDSSYTYMIPGRGALFGRPDRREAEELAKAFRNANARQLQIRTEDMSLFNGGQLSKDGKLTNNITIWWSELL